MTVTIPFGVSERITRNRYASKEWHKNREAHEHKTQLVVQLVISVHEDMKQSETDVSS